MSLCLLVRVWRMVEALESGIAGVNTPAFASAMAPFGRVKRSGLTREGSNSDLEGFLEINSSGRAGTRPQE